MLYVGEWQIAAQVAFLMLTPEWRHFKGKRPPGTVGGRKRPKAGLYSDGRVTAYPTRKPGLNPICS